MGIVVHCKEEKMLELVVNKKPQWVEVTCDCCLKNIPMNGTFYDVEVSIGEEPVKMFDRVVCPECIESYVSRLVTSAKSFEAYERVVRSPVSSCCDVTYICDEDDDEVDDNIDAFIDFIRQIASDKFQIEIVDKTNGVEDEYD